MLEIDGREELITGCPMKQIDRDTVDLCLAADMARHGSWPLAGGWLNQTRVCIEGVRFLWAMEDELSRPPDIPD